MGSYGPFRISRTGGMRYVESAGIGQLPFIVHAFCTRQGGVSGGSFASLNVSAREGDGEENVRNNLEIIAAAFAIHPDQFLLVDQVHGDGVLVIDAPMAANPGMDVILPFDAIVTDQPDVAIGIRTADCVPIFLVDRVNRCIGVVHAGWRGTALGIAARAIDMLVNRFFSRPEDIIAAVGPAIGACCYEVDEPVYRALGNGEGGDSVLHSCPAAKKWMLDLPRANIIQMTERGVSRENVSAATLCTSCRKDLFYSFRAEGGGTGRQLNFLMLKGQHRP